MKAKLVVVGGDAKATEINLKLPTIIGRGRDAQLTLPHPLVSRQHCEIFESSGRLVVRDLGSLNGTFVANERISEAVLPPGGLLTIGTVTFRAVYEEQPDVSPPTQQAPADPGDQTVTDVQTLRVRPVRPSDDQLADQGEIDEADELDDIAELPEPVDPKEALDELELELIQEEEPEPDASQGPEIVPLEDARLAAGEEATEPVEANLQNAAPSDDADDDGDDDDDLNTFLRGLT